jgi:hypothetical protein
MDEVNNIGIETTDIAIDDVATQEVVTDVEVPQTG